MFKRIKNDKHAFNLFLLLISAFILSQSYGAAISFAQPDSVLVCKFVQYCSNPVVLSTTRNDSSAISPITPETNSQTTSETNSQKTSDSSELLPDVTSNISVIMTPDLPGSLANEVAQEPANQEILATTETQPISPKSTENATVITPEAQSPPISTGENIAITTKGDNDTLTADTSPSNQSQLADTNSLDNATITIDDSNMSQVAQVDETNGTAVTTGANETNGTAVTTGANETAGIGTPSENVNLSPASNETIAQAPTNGNQQENVSSFNNGQPSSSPNSVNQTAAAPTFLDPIINPFKQLFGIK